MKLEIDIPFPEDALDDEAKIQLRRSLIEAAVLRLFEERRISSAEAARDLSLTRIQFMELTRRRGIPHYDYTAEDLAADLADLDSIESKLPHPSRRGE
jgi:predicted HTH domain antitoxin